MIQSDHVMYEYSINYILISLTMLNGYFLIYGKIALKPWSSCKSHTV
ncbi:hypothetical protein VAE122_3040262 [Vibrio aestuarianus]|nr:hypothetical protein VAE122_3040262 [Vibrio aestuarianus]